MDKSVAKGLELLSLKSSASTFPKSSDIGRITAQGYDTRLPHDDVVSMLRKHFSSCGEITDVYISIYNDDTLWHCAFIYFLGKGAVDKALQLNGTDVGGWNVSVTACPFPKHANDSPTLRVEGYDPSLSEDEIKNALIKFFSSCGKIEKIIIFKGYAQVSLFGEDAAVKAPELSGSDFDGHKLIVRLICGLGKTTVHKRSRFIYCGRHRADKKPKTTAE